jgi:hypothetical protein
MKSISRRESAIVLLRAVGDAAAWVLIGEILSVMFVLAPWSLLGVLGVDWLSLKSILALPWFAAGFGVLLGLVCHRYEDRTRTIETDRSAFIAGKRGGAIGQESRSGNR